MVNGVFESVKFSPNRSSSSSPINPDKKLAWKQIDDPKLFTAYMCDVHNEIHVYEPVNQIINTQQFQRLRRLKQLGLLELVYPTANHTRFEHSLGVYHLARLHMNALADKINFQNENSHYPTVNKDLIISSTDKLCVCIAGLIHDLGHGPLSHTYDEFLELVDPTCEWRHENQSVVMFRHLLENNPSVKRALDDYLDEDDYTFIEELVNPPKPFWIDDVWKLKGRPKEKSYLYDIVSNVHDSIDVDKLDYLLRDAQKTNVQIPFGESNLSRIRSYIAAKAHKKCGYQRIAYANKVIPDLERIINSREEMHLYAYQHKTKIAIEIMVLDAMVKASRHIYLRGSNRQLVCLAEAHKDKHVEAFLKLDDSILNLIRSSYEDIDDLEKARQLLAKIDRREHMHNVSHTYLTEHRYVKLSPKELQELITRDIRSMDKSITCQFHVAVRKIHRGMGIEFDPLSEILIYNYRDHSDFEVHSATNFRKEIKEKAGKAIVYVYVPRETNEVEMDKVYKAFTDCAKHYNAEIPQRRRKRSSRTVNQHYKDVVRSSSRRS